MTRSALLASGCLMALAVLDFPAAAQATVEAGLAAAGASTGAAGARNLTRGIGAAFGKLDQAAGNSVTVKTDAPKPGAAAKARAVPAKAVPEAAKAKPRFEDAAGIEKGMAREELLRRFGPPAMEFASGDDAKAMSYATASGAVQVELQGGKVTSVQKPKSGA